MMNPTESPRLLRRHCGGWLALAPIGATLKIGVCADGEEEAVKKYRTAVEQWRATLALSQVQAGAE